MQQLQTNHRGTHRPKPKLARMLERPRSHGRLFQRLGGTPVVADASEVLSEDLRDSNMLTLSEFSQRYMDLRDELALRKLRGEALTSREQSALQVLNKRLEELLPVPPRLPADVREVMAELRRLRG